MLSFLGLSNYSRSFVPDYAEHTAPLRAMVNEAGMRNLTAPLVWTESADRSFILLKQLLATATDMHLPDYSTPFYLDVSEKSHSVSAVLFQKKGGEREVLTYVSVLLDPQEKRQPPCARYASSLAKILCKVGHIVLKHPLTVLTSHSVVSFVQSSAFTMTSRRQTKIEKTLTQPHITYTHEGVNMAEGIGEGEPHHCAERIQRIGKVRQDLETKPLPNPELTFFTDGCCYRHPQQGLIASFAIVKMDEQTGSTEIVEAERLSGAASAQRAELVAVIRALKKAKEKTVNIFTDSAYVHSVIHFHLSEWQRAGFKTTAGTELKHQQDIERLIESIHLPSKVAVVKCKGHDKRNTWIAKGNEEADRAAKQAGGYDPQGIMLVKETETIPMFALSRQEIVVQQGRAAPQEKTMWLNKGAVRQSDGLWVGPEERPIPTVDLLRSLCEEVHGPCHVSKKEMSRLLSGWWHPYLDETIDDFVKQCEVCTYFNSRPTLKPERGRFGGPFMPGQEVVMDFTDMGISVRGQRFLLVLVDAFTGWPEAYPCRREDAKTVVKCLVNYYIPTHGFPKFIRSDNGTHFKNKDLQAVEKMLGLRHKFGTVYHPQSQGVVERMNGTIKSKLAKICAQTGLNWVDALPIVLMSIRSSLSSTRHHTPFELEMGRPFPGPAAENPGETVEGKMTQQAHYKLVQCMHSRFHRQKQDGEIQTEQDPVQLGPEVLLKVLKRKWSEPRWTGPYKVLGRTSHALRLEGKGDTWFHVSQCAPYKRGTSAETSIPALPE